MTFEEWTGEQNFYVDANPIAVAREAWQAAYRAGQEDMRERASELKDAVIAHGENVGEYGVCSDWDDSAKRYQYEIEALEIKGEGDVKEDQEALGIARLAWRRAFRAGQEEMRERAARIPDGNSETYWIADEIRALEIKEGSDGG